MGRSLEAPASTRRGTSPARLRRQRPSGLQPPDPQDIVVIGATGDLARRKLLPALYNLFVADLLPPEG